jgi:catechol 2,3-dioxygenase-like lactoylglutathione lyase family enzyme
VVTGIGFLTTQLEKTLNSLHRRKVRVEGLWPEGDGRLVSVCDPDGNVVFVYEPPKPKARRVGLQAMDFVTIATRDHRAAGEFFTKVLWMRSKQSPGEPLREYRLTTGGTALLPFTPDKEVYDNPKEYVDDMAHIGEPTSIMFTTKDLLAIQEAMLAKGVSFRKKASAEPRRGLEAEFLDPDGNRYEIIQR